MDTTNSAIAKLIAEAREQMKEQSRKGNHWFPSMTAWKLADTLEAVMRERDFALVREDLAVKVFQQEQDNVIALQSQIKAVTRERDEAIAKISTQAFADLRRAKLLE